MKGVRSAVKVTLILIICLTFGLLLGFGMMRAVNAGNLQDSDDLPTRDLSTAPTFAHERDARADVLAWLNDVKAMRADFVQIGPDGNTTRGTMYLERPGKIRFEYEPSVPLLIVADGTTLNLIDYDVDQVTSWPVKDTPLALLLQSPDAIEGQLLVSEAAAGPLAGTVSVSAEDPDHPEYGTVTFVFEREDNQDLALRAWRVVDAQGLVTTVSLGDTTLNTPIDDERFTFKDPRKGPVQRRRRAG